ncbi:MAG: nuclear transport factor 2 family protein [Candidatus Omnitrophota bacterium]
MRRIILSFFAVCILIGPVSAADDVQPTSIKDEVQSLFNTSGTAFDKEDVGGVVRAYLPAATLQYLDGTVLTADEWKANLKKNFNKIENEETRYDVTKAEAIDVNGAATVTAIHEYMLTGGKHLYRTTRTWQVDLTKTLNGWRIVRLKQLSHKMTCDGAPCEEDTGIEKF